MEVETAAGVAVESAVAAAVVVDEESAAEFAEWTLVAVEAEFAVPVVVADAVELAFAAETAAPSAATE